MEKEERNTVKVPVAGVPGNVFLQKVRDADVGYQLERETSPRGEKAAQVLQGRLARLAQPLPADDAPVGHVTDRPLVLDVNGLNPDQRLQQWLAEVIGGGSAGSPSGQQAPDGREGSLQESSSTTELIHREPEDSTHTGQEQYHVVDISKNPYNTTNRQIHDCVWCPCVLYTMFLCCVPAMLFMKKSDKLFNENQYKKAKIAAKISTVLYVIGFFVALCFFGLVAWIAYYFSQ